MQDLIKANAALLFAGIASFVLMGAGQSLYGPALPAFSRLYGVELGASGLIVSAHWIGCAVGVAGMFLAGPRITPRLVLVLMGVGAAVIAAGLGWVVSLLGAVVFGAGYGCATVVFNPRVLRAFGARGPAMVSLLNATFGVGAILAPLVFVAVGTDPRLAFAICAALAVAIWMGAGPASRPDTVVSETAQKPFRLHLPALCFSLVAIATEACLIGLGPAALIAAGESEVHAAQLLSLFFLAFLGSRVVLTFVAHLLPSFSLHVLAVGGTALAATGAALFDAGTFFIVMGVFAGMFFPSSYVTASRKMGDDPRVAPSIIAAGLVGGIAAPLLVSPFLAQMGDRGFFWVVAVVTGSSALVGMVVLKQMNR